MLVCWSKDHTSNGQALGDCYLVTPCEFLAASLCIGYKLCAEEPAFRRNPNAGHPVLAQLYLFLGFGFNTCRLANGEETSFVFQMEGKLE